jgi:nucleotide-binding universal stress UspA family protein
MAGRIVVGVDGSDHASAALGWAVEEAKLRGARVVAVYAWSFVPPPPLGAPDLLSVPVNDVAGDLEAEQAAAERALEASLAQLGADVDVERRLVEGDPAEVLVSEAEGADLVVVGSRGHGGLRTALLGSVSKHVIQHAPARSWSCARNGFLIGGAGVVGAGYIPPLRWHEEPSFRPWEAAHQPLREKLTSSSRSLPPETPIASTGPTPRA